MPSCASFRIIDSDTHIPITKFTASLNSQAGLIVGGALRGTSLHYGIPGRGWGANA